MPAVPIRELLDKKPEKEWPEGQLCLKLLCPYGLHELLYKVTLCDVVRLLDTNTLTEAPRPTHWVILNTSSGEIIERPVEDDFDPTELRGTNTSLIYQTAGRYWNALDASRELRELPVVRGAKAKVITEDALDGDDSAALDGDSVDSDGQPVISSDSKKTKRNRASKHKKPLAAVLEYRKKIVAAQASDKLEVFTLAPFGREVCTVFAQILQACEGSSTAKRAEDGFAFFYRSPVWLTAVEAQATKAGAVGVARVARKLLEGGESVDRRL